MKKINLKIFKLSLITILILVVIIVSLILNNKKPSKPEMGTLQNDTKEEIQERMKKKADPSIFAATMKQRITVKKGKDKVDLNIENMPENNYDIQVEITSKKDSLYTSEKIKPGYVVRKDYLKKELKKGNYLCEVVFTAFDKDGKEVKRANTQIQIVVQE